MIKLNLFNKIFFQELVMLTIKNTLSTKFLITLKLHTNEEKLVDLYCLRIQPQVNLSFEKISYFKRQNIIQLNSYDVFCIQLNFLVTNLLS